MAEKIVVQVVIPNETIKEIRNQALEEAAQIADAWHTDGGDYRAKNIANHIRELKK